MSEKHRKRLCARQFISSVVPVLIHSPSRALSREFVTSSRQNSRLRARDGEWFSFVLRWTGRLFLRTDVQFMELGIVKYSSQEKHAKRETCGSQSRRWQSVQHQSTTQAKQNNDWRLSLGCVEAGDGLHYHPACCVGQPTISIY
jgi:hypothetical protein